MDEAEGEIIEGIVGTGRLDKAISDAAPDLSRERVKALISSGKLRINKRTEFSGSDKSLAGARFFLTLPPPEPLHVQAEDIPLDVVYEDAHLIVIDKPAGMVVHPAPGNYSGTLVNALLHHCRGQLSGIGGVERPGIVHRIDGDTSGLLVVAKSDKAHQHLSKLFAAHDIERKYIAIVKGIPIPPAGMISTMMGRSMQDRKKMAVLGPFDPKRPEDAESRGKHAITHYKMIQQGQGVSAIECVLETGRTHQVRVHMAHIGHPLIGDQTYGRRRKSRNLGPAEADFNRQALHAASLAFTHPVSGEKLSFLSPIPDDMQELLSELFV